MESDKQGAPHSPAKPKWLKRVEEESWQAELIISGAAIIGSLQLPGFLDQLEVYLLLHQGNDALGLWRLVFLYLRLVTTALIFTFIFHFIVRALWIGMVGLNSVFPGGFRPNQRFSEDFQEKMRANYGNIDGYILRLDGLASGIFGIGFAAASLFFNLGLVFSAFVILIGLVQDFGTYSRWITIVIIVFAAAYFVMALLVSLLHVEKLRERNWVKRIHFPLTKIMYRFQFPINSRFTVTALNILSYQVADRRGYWLYGMGAGAAFAFFATVTDQLFSRNADYYYESAFFYEAQDSSLIRRAAYEEENYEGVYYGPVMPGRYVDSPQLLSVWIPLPERELVLFRERCGAGKEEFHTEEADLSETTLLDCLAEELRLAVNGNSVRGASLNREYLKNASGRQFGVRVHFANPPLKQGRNLLSVGTPSDYRKATDGTRMSYVVFFVR